MLALLVSGGHTELIFIKNWMKYKKIGETRDDAAGEAFDKVARMLGLPYPGGPAIAQLAMQWNNQFSNTKEQIKLPRPMISSKDYDFSFSGLKTAVLYLLRDLSKKHSSVLQNTRITQSIAHEFQEAVVDVLVKRRSPRRQCIRCVPLSWVAVLRPTRASAPNLQKKCAKKCRM